MNADHSMASTSRGRLTAALSAVAATVVGIVVAATALTTGGAGAETPAERCARETATYNQAWKQAWVAAHPGSTIDDAPAPTPPYICHDPGTPTSSAPSMPSVTAPSIPTTSSPGQGVQPTAHAPTDIPAPGTTPIVPVPGGSAQEEPESSRAETVTIPIGSTGQWIKLRLPGGMPGVAFARTDRGRALQQLSIRRQPGTSPVQIPIESSIPAGSFWQKLDGQRTALMGPGNVMLTMLLTDGFDLGVRGKDLAAVFKGTSSIGTLLSQSRNPADANGCTWTNGGALSTNCVNVTGSGTHIDSIQGQIGPSATRSLGSNMCDGEVEFSWYDGNGNRQQRTKGTPGCTPVVPGMLWSQTLNVDADAKDGSQVCTRSRSNLTQGSWSPYACETVKS